MESSCEMIPLKSLQLFTLIGLTCALRLPGENRYHPHGPPVDLNLFNFQLSFPELKTTLDSNWKTERQLLNFPINHYRNTRPIQLPRLPPLFPNFLPPITPLHPRLPDLFTPAKPGETAETSGQVDNYNKALKEEAEAATTSKIGTDITSFFERDSTTLPSTSYVEVELSGRDKDSYKYNYSV